MVWLQIGRGKMQCYTALYTTQLLFAKVRCHETYCTYMKVLSQVLNRGLMVEIQAINNVLNWDIPVVTTSSKQVFLADLMERKGDTPSCCLARWLQPDRAMDLDASELTLPIEPVKVGASSKFTLCTKDQDGKPIFVDDMKVCHSSLYCLLQGFPSLQNLVAISQKYCLPLLIIKAGCMGSNGKNWLLNPESSSQSEG